MLPAREITVLLGIGYQTEEDGKEAGKDQKKKDFSVTRTSNTKAESSLKGKRDAPGAKAG